MKKTLRPLLKRSAMALVVAGLPVTCFALDSLSEDELSGVNGQSGITYEMKAPSISATEWRFDVDAGGIKGAPLAMTPNGNSSLLASLLLDVGSIASPGTSPAISIVYHLDRFRLGGATGTGWTSSLSGDTTRSFGEWALVTDMDYSLVGQPMLVSPGTSNLKLALNDAALFYRQNSGHATLTMDNLNFLWDMQGGAVNIDTGGLRLSGDPTFRIGFDVFYKNNADQNMTNTTANDRPGIRFSWGGKLYDSLLYARSGGVWNTATDQGTTVAFNAAGTALTGMPTGQTQGVNLGMRWNYRNASGTNDFLWGVGHITGDQEYLEFGDWKNLEQATGAVPGRYGFDIPLLVIDALNAGSATNAGGTLCWGNTMTTNACSAGGGSLVGLTAGTVQGYSSEVNRTGGALYMQLIRNGNLLAWSNSVRVKRNPTAPTYEDGPGFGGNALATNGSSCATSPGNSGCGYSWGLVATLANINANIYLYPGGSETTGVGNRNQGALGDILFMSQSFGVWEQNNRTTSGGTCQANGTGCVDTQRWSQGTHLMVADTAAQMGIGILGASILLAADDLRLWLKDTTTDTSPGNLVGGVDLFSPRVRYNLKGLFGGARLPNGHDLIRVANIDMNLEGLLNFRISPPPTDVQSGKTAESNDYLAYSGAMRLRCGGVTAFGCTDNAFADSAGSSTASGSGSYISIEEPGKPGVDLRFADLSGDLAITEGVLQLRSAPDTAADAAPNSGNKFSTARADLTIANKILMGASASSRLTDGTSGAGVGNGGAAGRALTGNVRFGGNDIMSMAIPAASAYYSLTIRAQ